MKRYRIHILSVLSLFIFLSCGKKGPLEPPIIRVPKDIDLINLIQRGEKIIFQWKNPSQYIDGNPIREIARVEIWKLEKDQDSSALIDSVTSRDFKKEGELLISILKEDFPDYSILETAENPTLQFVLPMDKDFLGKKYFFSFRVADVRKRTSKYSQPVLFLPAALPFPPERLRAEVKMDKILLSWSAPETNIDQSEPPAIQGYNLYRNETGQVVRLNSSLIADKVYEDRDFIFGHTYSYFVRASASLSSPFLESDDSETLTVIPEDVFPPDPPRGLMAVSGSGLISLSWEMSPEKDIKGYRVWRRAENESDFVVLTHEPILENAYTDSAVEKNKRYYYAITALDGMDNESRKSSTVSEILREGLS